MRSHYDCRDLQLLFKLQPRSAQKLIELLPRQAVGPALLVQREHLAEFLERVRDSDNVTQLLEELRKNPPGVTRQKIRSLVRRDRDPPAISSLPSSVSLARGRLEISFTNAIELTESLLFISKIIESDEFEATFGIKPPQRTEAPRAVSEGVAILEELRRMEESFGRGPSSNRIN